MICTDPWILALLQDGFKLEFTEPPRQGSPPRNAPLNPEQSALWNLEIQNLIDKGAIVKASSQTFVSTVFVIPKSSGGWRPIINLKQLNEFLVYHRFKMEGLGSVRDLIKRGDWLAKLDITDAYLNVPIFPGHQQFLQFFWDGQLWQFCSLPFGLAQAPWAFTKLLKPAVSWLRSRGVRLVIYLDDILLLNSVREKLVDDIQLTLLLFRSLGFLINEKKSMLITCQKLEYLGVLINTVSFTFELPEDKRTSLSDACAIVLGKSSCLWHPC